MKQKYKVIMIFLFALMSILFCLSLVITMILKNEKLLLWLVLPIGMLWIITIPCFFYAGFSWGWWYIMKLKIKNKKLGLKIVFKLNEYILSSLSEKGEILKILEYIERFSDKKWVLNMQKPKITHYIKAIP